VGPGIIEASVKNGYFKRLGVKLKAIAPSHWSSYSTGGQTDTNYDKIIELFAQRRQYLFDFLDHLRWVDRRKSKSHRRATPNVSLAGVHRVLLKRAAPPARALVPINSQIL
jgi:hypothetical protein